jgi:UDP-N-acetylmuramoylalanine--D-glutamate ligase
MTTLVPETTQMMGRFIVFGAGRSGMAAARLLNKSGQRVLLCDEQAPEDLDDQLSGLCQKRIDFSFGAWSPKILHGAEALVISPGIPMQHELIAAAQERSIPVYGELELGARMAQPPIFAITGTNGKTTTTSLISHILTHCGFHAPSCGNIGRAFCDTMMSIPDPDDRTILVTEVSSFQLESIHEFHPSAAWLLNLTPDHLDRHGDMARYQDAKYRIAINQTEHDALVLNGDDPRVMPLASQARGEVFTFSAQHEVKNGAFLKNNMIWLCRDSVGEPFPLLPVGDIKLPGNHNIENVLAASLVTFFCDLNPRDVATAIKSFPGVEHRIEFICEHEGVRYFNDSKATNLDAMTVALKSFKEPVVLIAGGTDDGAYFDLLSEEISQHVRHVIAIGESAPRIADAWKEAATVEQAESLFEATLLSTTAAQPGDVVLLSPGCKSFDQFKNYEERGRTFKSTVLQTLLGIDYF